MAVGRLRLWNVVAGYAVTIGAVGRPAPAYVAGRLMDLPQGIDCSTLFGKGKMIRKATSDDIPGLMALQRSVEEENAIHGYRADSAEGWAARDLAWALVAVVEGQVVGFVYASPRPYSGECVFPARSTILEIVDLMIAESNRSRGLGHELVEALQHQALEAGFTHLRVYSAARRFDDIVEFYRSCGFSPWYLEMMQRLGAEPATSGDAEDRKPEP